MANLMKIVSKINNEMSQFIISELEKEGASDLVVSHGSILLCFLDEKQLNFKELSNLIGKSPQTMTTLIRKLETTGYVTFKKDEKDKRNKIVTLTQKGNDFLPVILRISDELYQKQYQGLQEEEIEQLRKLLLSVLDNF